jgi:hypothetical protein
VYTLSKGKLYVRFMLARSPFDLKKTADSFVKLSKIKSVKRTNKAKEVKITGTIKNKPVTIIFHPISTFIDIAMYGGQSAKRRAPQTVNGVRVATATLADIAALQRILNTRTGGVTVPLQVPIPTAVYTAADGTSATVPNLPGWAYNGGGGGMLSGAAAGQGVFEFGSLAVVSYPGLSGIIVNRYTDAANAIVEVWPKYAPIYTGAQVEVTGVQEIPGTDGFLAPNLSSSGLFAISVNINGEPWVGLMTSGTGVLPGAELLSYLWYHTFIAVPVNGPGGIGAALVNAWATWNHSAADAQHLAQAAATLASIQVGGGPIDPRVFQEKANAWDAYIRGND